MMSKEYIEREAAKKLFEDDYNFDAATAIDRIPAADVVEVVRCKNCEYYRQNEYSPDEDMMCMCWCDWLPTDPDDFCSSGRKKTD